MRWARCFDGSRASRSASCSASGFFARMGAEYEAFFPWIQRVRNSPEEASPHLARSGALRGVDEARRSVQRPADCAEAVIADIRRGGHRALFAPAGYKTLPG